MEWEGVENGRPQYGNMLDYIKRSGSEFLVVTAGVQHLGDTLESSVRRLLELDVLAPGSSALMRICLIPFSKLSSAGPVTGAPEGSA